MKIAIFKKADQDKLFLTKEPIFIEKSQEEGEKDLVDIAREPGLAEAHYLFIKSKKLWLGCTKEYSVEYLKKINRHVITSKAHDILWDNLKGKYKTHYHTHPSESEELDIQEKLTDKLKDDENARIRYEKDKTSFMQEFEQSMRPFIILGSVLPSYQDIAFSATLKKEAQRYLNLSICSSYGFCDISMSSKLNILRDLSLFYLGINRVLKNLGKLDVDDLVMPDLANWAVRQINQVVRGFELSFRYHP